MEGLRKQMGKGAVWMVAFKLLERSIGLISTLILARVLVPADFGTVAMAMSFVALIELMTAFGFDVALIQRQTTDRKLWDTAWTFGVMLGLLVALVMVSFSGSVAAFYRHAELEAVIKVLAIGSVVRGLENIGVVAFRTELRFDREFRFQLAKKLITFGITIPAALVFKSYWALVIGQTCGALIGSSLSYWVHPYRPRLTLAGAAELMNFSKWVLLLNVIGYLKERSQDWIIGRTSGVTALGLFTVSSELASLPSSELAAPINRAVFPGYAKIAHDRPRLQREYLSVMSMIVFIVAPAVAGLAATAPLVVLVVLGPKWVEAGPIMTLLCFYGITQIVQGNAQAAYVALGRPDVPAKLNATHVVLKVTLMLLLASSYGLIGAAAATLGTALVMIPVSLAVLFRMLDIEVREFFQQVWRSLTASAVMFVAVLALVRRLESAPGSGAAFVELLASISLGVVVHATMTLSLWWLSGWPPGAERTALGMSKQLIARFRPDRPG